MKDAQEKSRSIMANFFGKAKPVATSSPSKLKASTKDGQSGSPDPTSSQSDFQRTFRPFVVKKDAEVAPQNWFRDQRRRQRARRRSPPRTEGDVIVIEDDEDEDEGEVPPTAEDVEMADSQELDTDSQGE